VIGTAIVAVDVIAPVVVAARVIGNDTVGVTDTVNDPNATHVPGGERQGSRRLVHATSG